MEETIIKKDEKLDNANAINSSNIISNLPNWENVSTAVRSDVKDETIAGYSVYHAYNSSLW